MHDPSTAIKYNQPSAREHHRTIPLKPKYLQVQINSPILSRQRDLGHRLPIPASKISCFLVANTEKPHLFNTNLVTMSASTATTPRTSIDLVKTPSISTDTLASSSSSQAYSSKAKGIWQAIKRHHQELNCAFETYYGQGQHSSAQKQQEVWEYKRSGRK